MEVWFTNKLQKYYQMVYSAEEYIATHDKTLPLLGLINFT